MQRDLANSSLSFSLEFELSFDEGSDKYGISSFFVYAIMILLSDSVFYS